MLRLMGDLLKLIWCFVVGLFRSRNIWQDTGDPRRICGRPLMASTIWRFARLGRLRSYVRPFGAEHISAGPDEVRQPGVTSRMRASRSYDGSGCSWSSVATVVIHRVFVALTKL